MLGLAVLITVLAGFAIAGAAVDDRAIAANPATAEAEVLEGSSFARTLVRFTVANGEVWVPERGVFYPRGLQPGDKVAVEYDVTDPELVRVAGRERARAAWVRCCWRCSVSWVLLGPARRCGSGAAGPPPRADERADAARLHPVRRLRVASATPSTATTMPAIASRAPATRRTSGTPAAR